MSVCFFTVCGGGEEYDFLLGSIEHHSEIGRFHLVLDTTPAPFRRTFVGLPRSVRWVQESGFGSGWQDFNMRAALERAAELARESGASVLAQLDCDEFYSPDLEPAISMAERFLVAVETYHWRVDGRLYSFGPSEFHRRMFPANMKVQWPVNQRWLESPHYNGNPNHHPRLESVDGLPARGVPGIFHHHVHYAIGQKAQDDGTARTMIDGWPNGIVVPYSGSWPAPLRGWFKDGKRPSERFTPEILDKSLRFD